MAEEYNIQAIINDLKEKEEMDPDKHDGCYELMRETISAYAKLDDFSVLDYKDLNLVYLTTVGTWKQGIESKKKAVEESHLLVDDKEYLKMLWDEIWEKAGRGEYTNNELDASGNRSIGLFGTGFFSFQRTTTAVHAQEFIRMCCDILPMKDDNMMFERAARVLTVSFQGMRAASASMILHCLKPYSFPVLNSNMGRRNIFEVLGVQLSKKDSIETYIENCRKIKAYRDANFSYKNYRIFDIAAWKVAEYAKTHEYGRFGDWEVLSETVARLYCRSDELVLRQISIPQELRWFFRASELRNGARQDVVLIYDGFEYDGYLLRESVTPIQIRIYWDESLSEEFGEYAKSGREASVEFTRIEDDRFEVRLVEPVQNEGVEGKRAWLLTWNKKNWEWVGYQTLCEETKAGQTIVESWACVSSGPRIGDEVFLIKLGEHPRGIVGHGKVVREQYEKEHYDSGKASEGKKEKAVDVEFDRLIDHEHEKIISQDELNARCAAQHWSPQASGIEIKQEVLPALHVLWKTVSEDHETYGFDEIVSFLRDYKGKHYVAPEKAGDRADQMTRMRDRGQRARQRYIDFIKAAISDIPEIGFVSCSNWINQGQVVERYLWAELKSTKWQDRPHNVSVSVEEHNERIPGQGYFLYIRSDLRDTKSDDLDRRRQIRLLDCELPVGAEYAIKYDNGGYSCVGKDAAKVKEAYDSGDVAKIMAFEQIDDLPLKDQEGTILSETQKAIREIYPLYEYVASEEGTASGEGWWPDSGEYDPGITAQEYHDLFLDERIVKRTWLDALYEMYQMPGHLGTCKQMGERYGHDPAHYVSYLTSAATRIAKEKNCALSLRDEGNARYWPILFVGRAPGDRSEGNYCWKMREPVVEAMERLISEGVFEESKAMVKFDHNMILYGPPGTGKTYNSVIYAVAICEGRPTEEVGKENYPDVLARYNELRREGRILFTTFHQSYGYEEFIEGIRPVMANDEDNGGLDYEIKDGIFKAICNAARTPVGTAVDHNASIWFVRLKDSGDNDLKRECFDGGEIRFEGPEDPDDGFSWEYERLSKMKPGDYVISYGGKSVYVDGIGVVEDDGPIYDQEKTSYRWTRKVKWLLKDVLIDVKEINSNRYLPNFNLAAMSHMKLSDLLKAVEQNGGHGFRDNDKDYVIIIDEINRGNVSKIFGELITLIEETKREGAAEAMEAVLPYSGESFSVPDNVYILGTMNTADRSIALMDTALRRRFEFVEMMPDPEVLESLGVGTILVDGEELNVARMLAVINERIEYLFDREHTIGHAFFTRLKDDPSIETLAGIFEKNVIPLLQEYFYEDYEKIQLVLGDNDKEDEFKFVLDKKVELKQIFKGNPDIDLPPKGYSIQRSAFRKLQSYKLIGKEL